MSQYDSQNEHFNSDPFNPKNIRFCLVFVLSKLFDLKSTFGEKKQYWISYVKYFGVSSSNEKEINF